MSISIIRSTDKTATANRFSMVYPIVFAFSEKSVKLQSTVYIQQTPTFVLKNYFVLDIQGKLSLQNGCEPIGTNVKTIRVICITPMTTHQNVHYAALTLSTKPNMF